MKHFIQPVLSNLSGVLLMMAFMATGCQQPDAMLEQNKILADRFHTDIIVGGNLDVADEIISSDFVAHAPLPPEFTKGPEGVKLWATAYRTGMPNDLSVKHFETIAEGDLVMIRFEGGGTHEGVLMGVPPSGNYVTVTGIDLFRIEDGKIVEMWQELDVLGMMQQIGALPAPE
ncbi:ester cyclase [Candidatus Neomarinimicrobiota bacterium]